MYADTHLQHVVYLPINLIYQTIMCVCVCVLGGNPLKQPKIDKKQKIQTINNLNVMNNL